MKDDIPWPILLGSLLISAIAIFGIGLSEGRADIEKQAILNGAAHYAPDAEGKPKFTWNNKSP